MRRIACLVLAGLVSDRSPTRADRGRRLSRHRHGERQHPHAQRHGGAQEAVHQGVRGRPVPGHAEPQRGGDHRGRRAQAGRHALPLQQGRQGQARRGVAGGVRRTTPPPTCGAAGPPGRVLRPVARHEERRARGDDVRSGHRHHPGAQRQGSRDDPRQGFHRGALRRLARPEAAQRKPEGRGFWDSSGSSPAGSEWRGGGGQYISEKNDANTSRTRSHTPRLAHAHLVSAFERAMSFSTTAATTAAKRVS